MDYRKISSHIIMLGVVIVIGLLTAIIVRLSMLENGADTGTANLVFIFVIGVCAVVYLIILSTLSKSVVPWILKRLPKKWIKEQVEAEFDDEEDTYEPDYDMYEAYNDVEDNKVGEEEEEPGEIIVPLTESKPAKPDWKELYEKEIQSKLSVFLEYSHLTMGPYVTEDELKRLDEYIELFVRDVEIPKDITSIKPARLKNPDLFHFGWNMQYYFGVGKREDVVPWLQSVFAELNKLSFSTIKGKLHDYQTQKYTIPNIDDIPKFMAGKTV